MCSHYRTSGVAPDTTVLIDGFWTSLYRGKPTQDQMT